MDRTQFQSVVDMVTTIKKSPNSQHEDHFNGKQQQSHVGIQYLTNKFQI